jgi:hypothetical protein
MAKKTNSTDIGAGLWNYFQNYDYKLNNTYVFAWESDFFAVSKTTGYMYEVEVKISRGDFKADLKKNEKHFLLKNHKIPILTKPNGSYMVHGGTFEINAENERVYVPGIRLSNGIDYVYPSRSLPNCFYYCCPRNLIKLEEIPAYAGLLYYEGSHIYLMKKAPFLHRNNLMTRKRSVLLDKFYWLSINSVRDLRYARREDDYYQRRLRETETFLRRHGINAHTGKKITKDNIESFNYAYEEFSKFLLKELKVEKVTTSKIYDIIYAYQNPELNHPQLFKPIKKRKT